MHSRVMYSRSAEAGSTTQCRKDHAAEGNHSTAQSVVTKRAQLLRWEARTRTIPFQFERPRGQRGPMFGHTGRKTIPEARDSIGCRVSFIGSYSMTN
jgi:hypothetical protein